MRSRTTWTKETRPVPSHPLRKMTPVKIEEARRLLGLGVSHKNIGRGLGVSADTIMHHCGKSVAKTTEFLQCRRCGETKHREQFSREQKGKLCNHCTRTADANRRLKWYFGISLIDYQRMFESQGNACAICRTLDPTTGRKGVKRFSVDHDHDTGIVRGLLCHKCNGILGLADERVEVLESAISYLKLHANDIKDRTADSVKGCK